MVEVSKDEFIGRLSRLYHTSEIMTKVSELAYLTFCDKRRIMLIRQLSE